MRAPLAIALAGATLIAGGACSTGHPKPLTVAAVAAVSHHHDVPEPPTTTTTTTRPQPAVAMTWPPAPHKAKSHGCAPRSMSQIAQDENHGRYTGKNPHSTASGKYQVLDSTWGGYAGYAHAQDAPPDVQEKQAGELYAQWQSGKIPNPWAASGC